MEKGNRSIVLPANEVKAAVRDKKLDIYAKLREVEQERFSLGLMRTSGGEVYQATDFSELQKKRDTTEKHYSKLLDELSTAKKYEKRLGLLGSEKLEIIQGKALSDPEALADRQGFLQQVKKAQKHLQEISLNQMKLQREPPQSLESPE